MLVLESIATETEVDFREGRRLHRSFSSLQSLFDLRAALDPETSRVVIEQILRLKQSATIIAASHDATLIEKADVVVTL